MSPFLVLGGAVDRVAGRADGAHDVGIPVRVQCLAQAAYVHVDSPRLNINIVAPNRVEKLLAGENPSGISHQVAQQAKLGRAEMDRFAATRHAMRGEIHRDIGELRTSSTALGWARRITARSRATSSLGLKGLTT